MGYTTYVDEWLEKYPSIQAFNKLSKRGRITHTTVENYVKVVKEFCEIIGHNNPETALEEIKRIEEIEDWLDNLVGTIREKVGDTRSINIFKGVKWWLTLNKVDVDWQAIILPSYEAQVEDRAPTKEEIRKLLSFGNIRDQALILVAATSGLRMNTLRTLTFGDVNFDCPDVARILVKKQYEVDGMVYTSGRKISKKRKFYATFITPEAKKALLDYKQYRIDEGEEITDKSPLFTSTKRNEMGQFLSHKQYLSTHWGRLLKRAHLDKKSEGWFILHFHTLKKFAETQFINAGVTPSYREFWLGHKGAYLESSYFRGEEEKHLEEYRKTIPYLTIIEATDRFEVEMKKRKILEDSASLPLEVRQKIEQALASCITMKQLNQQTEYILPLLKRSENCQKIIDIEQLETHLTQGWRFISALPNGKAVIEKNGS